MEPKQGPKRKPGPPKGVRVGGRKQGTPNKLTGEVKAMVLQALEMAGGVDYLASQAVETPTAFLSLVGKILPLQVTGENGGPVKIATIDLRAVYPKTDAGC